MTIRIAFLGTGNAFADGGRSHACIHVAADGVSLLLDCGGSSLPMIRRHIDPALIDAIAVTHLHGDHFGGITFLVLEQHFAGRSRPLTVGGPPSIASRLRALEDAIYPDFFGTPGQPRFPVREVVLGASETELGGAMVSAHPVRHVPLAEPHGLRIRAGGRTIAYSGDAVWSEELVRLAKGADLFICESTSFETEDPVHVSYRTLMRHRAELDCGRIVLTHVGAEVIRNLDEVELEVAGDGMVVEL